MKPIPEPNWTSLIEHEDIHGVKVVRFKKAIEWWKEHVVPVNEYIVRQERTNVRRKRTKVKNV